MSFPLKSSADFNQRLTCLSFDKLKCNTYLSILHKIVFDDLTELLRELLQRSIANSQIEDYYKAIRGQLTGRFTQREEELINNAAETGYQCFDITILTKLLRFFSEKINFERHLLSLSRVRNEICHLPNTDITQSQFETYFDECCDIASALEDYQKKPNLLTQKFQSIYKVNTRLKEGRTDLEIEALSDDLTELNTAVEEICLSDLEEKLYILEKQISQIDRQTDERHRQVVHLKTWVQQVHKKFDPPEESYFYQNAQEGQYIKPESRRTREPPDDARQDCFLDIAEVLSLSKTVEKERPENIQHVIPFSRPTPHIESLDACADHPTVVETYLNHSADFPTMKSAASSTIKPVFCADKRSSNKIEGSVVHLKGGTNHRCELGQSSSFHVGIVENKSVLQSSSIQLTDEELWACRSQSKDKLAKTDRELYHKNQTSNRKQIQVGGSLANTDLHLRYPLPFQGNVSNSNGIDLPQNYKTQSTKPHLLRKGLSLLSSKAKQLCDVFSSKRNRKSEKRKKKNDRLKDLNVDWRLGDIELNKELENHQDHDSYYGTSVVLHSNDDNENAENFHSELNQGVPSLKIEFQGEVCLPGQYRSNVTPYLTRQYIFVLITKNYKKSADFQHTVKSCIAGSLEDKKCGQLIPVLMTKKDILPKDFWGKNPVLFYDENSMKNLFRSILYQN